MTPNQRILYLERQVADLKRELAEIRSKNKRYPMAKFGAASDTTFGSTPGMTNMFGRPYPPSAPPAPPLVGA